MGWNNLFGFDRVKIPYSGVQFDQRGPLWTSYHDLKPVWDTLGDNVTKGFFAIDTDNTQLHRPATAGVDMSLLNQRDGILTGAKVKVNFKGDLRFQNSPAANDVGDVNLNFSGFTDYMNTNNHAVELIQLEGDAQTLVFSGLDPDKRYIFAGTGDRNNISYTDRWSICSIQNALTLSNNSSPGTTEIAPSIVAFNTGYNINGYVWRWDSITPSASGTFLVGVEQYTGGGNEGSKGYGITMFMIKEM